MMKRTVRIDGNLSGVISTGEYQNMRPGFVWEETYEDCNMTDEEVMQRRWKLYEYSQRDMSKAEHDAIIRLIERQRGDFRWAISPATNEKYPSTTSVRDWDADFFVSQKDLREYASQSNIVHEIVNVFIETGQWVKVPETDIFNMMPKELSEIWADVVIVLKGDLKLSVNSGNFKGFLEKYPLNDMKVGYRAFNEELKTHGTNDFSAVPAFKGAEPIESCCDVKRTPDKVKDGMQMADYCKQRGLKQAIIVPLNDKTEQGFSKPTVYNEKALEGLYKMFIGKRNDFKKRYGI